MHGAPPTHLTLDRLSAAGLPHATTTRHCPETPGGDPPFGVEARTALGGGVAAVAFARQVHGAHVVRATTGGALGEADAIVTTAPAQPIAVVSADCLPIVLYDPEAAALAVAHVGWRGTVKHTPRAAVAALARLGAAPARMLAAIGPSIGPCCYEVDEPVVGPLRAAFPGEWERWTRPRGPGKWSLDLWHANADQLVRGGVRSDAIANPRLCTSCRDDLFFSYRREGRGGSLAAFAALGR
jgi:YfiH family protein